MHSPRASAACPACWIARRPRGTAASVPPRRRRIRRRHRARRPGASGETMTSLFRNSSVSPLALRAARLFATGVSQVAGRALDAKPAETALEGARDGRRVVGRGVVDEDHLHLERHPRQCVETVVRERRLVVGQDDDGEQERLRRLRIISHPPWPPRTSARASDGTHARRDVHVSAATCPIGEPSARPRATTLNCRNSTSYRPPAVGGDGVARARPLHSDRPVA